MPPQLNEHPDADSRAAAARAAGPDGLTAGGMAGQEAWCPFRLGPSDLAVIGADVSAIPQIQEEALARNKNLHLNDRVAHQYQIAGGKVLFKLAEDIPDTLRGVGLFQPGATYLGVGRISTGLCVPHSEGDPDFLGLRTAFQTHDGKRVDFIAINNPTSPADDHQTFMAILKATGDSAGKASNSFQSKGLIHLFGVIAQQTALLVALVRHLGLLRALGTSIHLAGQTLPTSFSRSAHQKYWTGVVEVGGEAGKFSFTPVPHPDDGCPAPGGADHLTREWRRRLSDGDIAFQLHWLPFIDQRRTSTEKLTRAWDQINAKSVGLIVFPRCDVGDHLRPEPGDADPWLWEQLASEMGANPGNWVADREGAIKFPSTRFGVAREIAYGESQAGRDALDPSLYSDVFDAHRLSEELIRELTRRESIKRHAGHIWGAPRSDRASWSYW